MAKKDKALEMSKKEALLVSLEALVAEYNESAEFKEYKEMQKLSEKISEKISEYNAESEKECFAELKKAENPLLAAAEVLRYKVVKTKVEKEEGESTLVTEFATRPIDPLRLHRKLKGVGADKSWPAYVEELNKTMTIRRCIECGIDPADVKVNYAMSDAAKALDCFLTDDINAFSLDEANEHTRHNMQIAVKAMIGDGFPEVTKELVNYVMSFYCKKDSKTQLKLVAANHARLGQYILEVCHALITGAGVSVSYKKA